MTLTWRCKIVLSDCFGGEKFWLTAKIFFWNCIVTPLESRRRRGKIIPQSLVQIKRNAMTLLLIKSYQSKTLTVTFVSCHQQLIIPSIFELISQLYKRCPFYCYPRSKTSIYTTLPESSSYSHCLFWLSPSPPRFSLHSINNLLKLTFLNQAANDAGWVPVWTAPQCPVFWEATAGSRTAPRKVPKLRSACGSRQRRLISSPPRALGSVVMNRRTLFVKQKQLTILRTEYYRSQNKN